GFAGCDMMKPEISMIRIQNQTNFRVSFPMWLLLLEAIFDLCFANAQSLIFLSKPDTNQYTRPPAECFGQIYGDVNVSSSAPGSAEGQRALPPRQTAPGVHQPLSPNRCWLTKRPNV
ncbi:MAG: hypothetical protein JXQ27_17360, partial [Acidobacteria bacterium]|nr:hypothetical protein [Acidobacteriota bacterium]